MQSRVRLVIACFITVLLYLTRAFHFFLFSFADPPPSVKRGLLHALLPYSYIYLPLFSLADLLPSVERGLLYAFCPRLAMHLVPFIFHFPFFCCRMISLASAMPDP